MKTKNFIAISAAAVSLACAVSCQRAVPEVVTGLMNPIEFSVHDFLDISISGTRSSVDPVRTLDEFEVTATTGDFGAETMEWGGATFSKQPGSEYYTGGKMWPSREVAYHFYAANSSLSFSPTGCTVHGDGTRDMVCSYLPQSVYNQQNALTFNHIYARLGEVNIETQTGYVISDVSVSIECPVEGTYDLRSGDGKSDGTGWIPAEPAVHALATGENDLYVIPGEYALCVSYRLTKGEWSESFEKTASVALEGGKINNIKGTAIGGDASEVAFDVTVAEWSSKTVNVDWDAQ